jgi:hypothetical protein
MMKSLSLRIGRRAGTLRHPANAPEANLGELQLQSTDVNVRDAGHVTWHPPPPSGAGTHLINPFVFSDIEGLPWLKFVYPKELRANYSF